MDDIYDIVFQYRGAPLSNRCMGELRKVMLHRRGNTLEICGALYFKVEKLCVCNDNCGGLFCDAIVTKQLCGLTNYGRMIQLL